MLAYKKFKKLHFAKRAIPKSTLCLSFAIMTFLTAGFDGKMRVLPNAD
jgi:hypothetical protein